jgi:hypothetical protein
LFYEHYSTESGGFVLGTLQYTHRRFCFMNISVLREAVFMNITVIRLALLFYEHYII